MPEYIMPGREHPAFQSFDLFTQAYIEAALFTNTGTDEGDLGHPSTVSWQQIAVATLDCMLGDCREFQRVARHLLVDDLKRVQAGHDFWMTRNGHGSGFWDGDWPKAAGTELTAITRRFREVNLYRGDDGRIHD